MVRTIFQFFFIVNFLCLFAALKARGFYTLDSIPEARIRSLQLNEKTIHHASSLVGVVSYTRMFKNTPESQKKYLNLLCGDFLARKIDREYCKKLKEIRCEKECSFEADRHIGSGVLFGKYFITARHTLPEAGKLKNPIAKFLGKNGNIKEFQLKETPGTYHKEPYDLAIFEVLDWKNIQLQFPQQLKIASSHQENTSVFGLGFPTLGIRKEKAKELDYALEPSGVRVTFGKVIHTNEEKKSYCSFTNEDDVTDVEAWKLEDDCTKVDNSKFKFQARVETDPFLTDTDMTWGMSGSPLFDKNGNLIGIGSNVLSNNPTFYDPKKYAVYVKANNIQKLLTKLAIP